MVEPGFSGETAPIGNHRALAESMLRAWRQTNPWPMAGFPRPQIFGDMDPNTAIPELLRFAESAGALSPRTK
jgi:hypothetical protein